jgi:uncharacterized tellurite resistance protein B-like protein
MRGQDKVSFIRLLICVAHADGDINPSEKEVISEIVNSEMLTVKERHSLIYDFDWQRNHRLFAENLASVLTKPQKMYLLKKLYQLALSDGHLTPPEKEMIREISQIVGVSIKKLEEIESWVLEGVAWENKWKAIVSS